MKFAINVDYRAKRREAYPPIGDQLDALWKALAADPSAIPAPAAEMLIKIQSVKQQIPKPIGE